MVSRYKLGRRGFLMAAGGAAATAGLAGCSAVQRLTGTGDHSNLTATQAVAAMRSADISAESYAEDLIARTRQCNNLNAYISFDADALTAAARRADKARKVGKPLGALHGLPVILKDNIDTRAMATSGGTRALAKNIPPRDAPVAAALFGAGALLAGKANMHELAFGITNNNGVFGPARNPYNAKMIPGGSSGGTGAAVGGRLAPAGLGSDTGGSVRIPAALCGICGLRPTVGRYPGRGIVPISATRDTAGPMGRRVADLALLDGVLTGGPTTIAPADLRKVRLGVPRGYFYDDLDPEVARLMERSLAVLKDAGATLVEVDIRNLAKLNGAVSFPVALYEVMRDLPRYLKASAPGIDLKQVVEQVGSPDVRGVLLSQMGKKKMPRHVYRAAIRRHRPVLQAAYRRYFERNRLDAVVFPTTPLPARPIGQDKTVALNGKQVPTFPTYIRNTDPGSNAGVPGLSVPAGLTADGLPVGIAFDGPAKSDRRLLAIGAAFEKLVPALPPPTACG